MWLQADLSGLPAKTGPKSRPLTKGDQAFAVEAPTLWNSQALGFKKLLKPHLIHMHFAW